MSLIKKLDDSIRERTRKILLMNVDSIEHQRKFAHVFENPLNFLDNFARIDDSGKYRIDAEYLQKFISQDRGKIIHEFIEILTMRLILKTTRQFKKQPKSIYSMVILLSFPMWRSCHEKFNTFILKINSKFRAKATISALDLLTDWMLKEALEAIRGMIIFLNKTKLPLRKKKFRRVFLSTVRFMSLLYISNTLNHRIDFSYFVFTEISEAVVLKEFFDWQQIPTNTLTVCKNSSLCLYPQILPINAKIECILLEIAQIRALQVKKRLKRTFLSPSKFLRYLFDPVQDVICIDRDDLVNSTIKELAKRPDNFTKTLIKFNDEDAIDFGGVFREWIEVLANALVNDEELFVYDTQNGVYWPKTGKISDENLKKMELFGTMMALAIFNKMSPIGVDLPVLFFEKLTGINNRINRLDIDTFASVDYEAALHLRELYECDNPFEIIDDGIAENERTREKLQECIENYIDDILNTQLTKQFKHISKGFISICNLNSLMFLTMPQLKQIICGRQLCSAGFMSLKKNTIYRDCVKTDQIIVWFWEIVNEFSKLQQEKLLHFITGSKRIPHYSAPGIRIMLFDFKHKENPVNPNNIYLPTAQTCSRLLILDCAFISRELLKSKLEIVIELNEDCFGLK